MLIIGILYYVFIYIVDNLVPEPPQRIVKIAATVIICLLVVLALLDVLGVGTGLRMPRLVN
jgi:H+/Cl- antiporter ClcA